jgi:hypothetical protein
MSQKGQLSPLDTGPHLRGGGADRSESGHAAARRVLNFGLFGYFEGVINLDPKVPDCTFQFAMA